MLAAASEVRRKKLLLCFPIFKQFSSKLRAWRVLSPRLAAKEATGVTGRQPMKQLSVLRGALSEVRLTVSRKLLIPTLQMQRTVTQDSAIRKALKEYKIRFNLVKHTSTPQRLEHYCAHRSKIQKQIAALFSSSISRRKPRDASKIFRAMRLQTLAERRQ